jgi:N-acetyl-anhydromuramyl-L-alanine amidase AmpD
MTMPRRIALYLSIENPMLGIICQDQHLELSAHYVIQQKNRTTALCSYNKIELHYEQPT